MSGISPASILFSTDGYELAVVSNTTIPAGTRSILSSGSDGTNSRVFAVDSSGRSVVVGAGTAGTATGGVITIQGIAGGTAVPISGSITATNASVSTTGSAVPGSASLSGTTVASSAPTLTNGNLASLYVTTAGRLIIDGSQVTQPVSGTVTANAGTGTFNVAGTGTAGTANAGVVTIQGIAGMTAVTVSASGNFNNASVSATAATPPASATYLGGSVTTASPTYTTGQMNALSLTTSGALRIDGSGVTQPVSGTVTANIGTSGSLALDATLTGGTQRTKITDGTTNAAVKASSTAAVASDPALVVAISPNNTLSVITDKSSTGTITSVVSATTSTSILASNASRVSATIYNAANKTMYLALAGTASLSSYTVPLFANSYWELPVSYTGAISAVWASGVSGSALVTELT